MDLEILEIAKELQDKIKRYDALLECKKSTYYWVEIQVTCANRSPKLWNGSTIEREIFNKMLEILQEERDKVVKELEEL